MPGLLDLVGNLLGTSAADSANGQSRSAQVGAQVNAQDALQGQSVQNQQYSLPYVTTGTSAEQQLARMYGLADGGVTTAAGIVGGVNGGADLNAQGIGHGGVAFNATDTAEWNNYLKANPDVAASYQAQLNNPGFAKQFPTIQDFAAYHYTANGQSEGRTATPTLGQPTSYTGATGAGATTAGVDPNASFYLSPDYQFSLSRGLGAVQAGAAANGLADSGAVRKAEIAYGSGLASQQYQQYANRLQQIAAGGQTSGQTLTSANTGLAGGVANSITGLGNNLASSYLAQGATDSKSISGAFGALSGIGQTLASSFLPG